MNNIITLLLTPFIMIYGLLLIIGGPAQANRLPRWLGNQLRRTLVSVFRELAHLVREIGAFAIRFVFSRPRR
jgi:hypothetical protein